MATEGLITADALERTAGAARDFELVRGVLVPVNPPGHEHGRLAVIIAARLLAFIQPRALGTVQVETGFTLFRNPDTVRGPEVSFVRRERLTTAHHRGYIAGAPDLAVEVRSPNDDLDDVFEKAGEYVLAGARLVWVIDPELKTAWVYRPGRERLTLTSDDPVPATLDGADVLAGFTLPLAELFADPI